MHLLALPALADNYIWLLHDDAGDALVVDPGDADVVERALTQHKLRLRNILLTHHHLDHVGGASHLRNRYHADVYAPHDPRIEHVDHCVGDNDTVTLSAPTVQFRVIAVPGHTLTHIAFAGEGLLFCGDTLFSLGCGRLFEGSAEQMLTSLDRLAELPADTLVCCAHEYTAANGRFALHLDSDNDALKQRVAEVASLRENQLPSLPVTLERERRTNPFLRVDAPALVAWGQSQGIDPHNRVRRFAAIRAAKDNFRG